MSRVAKVLSFSALALVVWFVGSHRGSDVVPSAREVTAAASSSQGYSDRKPADESGSKDARAKSAAEPLARQPMDSPRAPRHGDPRSIVASHWANPVRPEQVAFRHWVDRYLGASPGADRDRLVAEGAELAAARRMALARLIVSDPESALASAVPVSIRAALPAEIVARLETRVSARGELALNAITPAPGFPMPSEPSYRSAFVEGAEYRAYVYGRRSAQTTLLDAALTGIAVDRAFAVADSPVRLIEPGETLPASVEPVLTCAACAQGLVAGAAALPGSMGYEYAGRIGIASSAAHFQADALALESSEQDLTEADNQPGTNTVVGRPSQAWTHGPKKIVIIRVVFSDTTDAVAGSFLSEDAAVSRFQAEGGVGEFYFDSSFGKTSLVIRPTVGGDSPDVSPVLRLARSALSYAIAGDSTALHVEARAAATAAGIDLAGYDRVGVVFPSLRDLQDASGNKSKITYGGLATVIGPYFWVNGEYSFRVVAHELGHTYGLRHANLWKVVNADPVSETGSSGDYGDPFDIMGGGEDFSSKEDFGPWNKSLLQWIPDSAVTTATLAGDTYRIYRFDALEADLRNARALKIVRDPTRDYWIGYRRATSSASLDGGAYVVWGYNSNRPGDLLDLSTPGSDAKDAALPIGATFDDVAAGIKISPLEQGGSGADEWLDIKVIIRPRVQWLSSEVLSAEQGGIAKLTLRRTGDSAGALSVDYSTEDGTAVAAAPGPDYVSSNGTVSWADGDLADKTLTIPLLDDGVIERSETFLVRLGAVTGGVRVGPAAATVTIAEAGATDATFRSDFINSNVNRVLPLPDGSLLAGGAFDTIQDSAFAKFEGVGRLALFKSNGAVDVDYNLVAGANGTVRALARQADGRILVGGDFTSYGGVTVGRIVRIFPDGSLDPSFKPGVGADKGIHDIVLQPDGRIYVAGAFATFGAAKRNRLVRLNPDGSIDTTFADPAFAATTLRSLALQPDGKVLVAGGLSYSGLPGEGFKSGVARLNANGSRDASFDVGFGAHSASSTSQLTTVFRIALQPDGRVIAVGDFGGFGGPKGTARSHIARLAPSGAVDLSFAPRPVFEANPAVTSLVSVRTLPGNRFLVGGAFTKINNVACSYLALVNEDGSIDETFAAAGGHAGTVADFALLPDGKVVLAGSPSKFQDSTLQRPLWRFIPGLAGAPGVVEFAADGYSGREGGVAILTVHRTGGFLGAATVAYAAARGKTADTATISSDYTLAAGTLSWADGDDSDRTITIPLAKDDPADDGETFTVRLGEPALGGVALGARREAVVTILPFDVRAQTITFNALPDYVLSPTPITLGATSSSGLIVTYELVSGTATLDGAVLTPTGPGIITVRAKQLGTKEHFDPAVPVIRSFTAFTPATVTLNNLAQVYTATPREVGFISTPSGLAATITYNGSSTRPTEVGKYTVNLAVAEPLFVGSATGTLDISKAPLAIRPDNQRRLVGTLNAPITLGYAGFLGDDSATDLDKLPLAKTVATKASKPGVYPITLTGGLDNNYNYALTSGAIHVLGFGGAYESLLVAPGAEEPLGKLNLTISPTLPTFSGTLDLGAEPAGISINGALVLDPQAEPGDVDQASGAWTSSVVAPSDYRVSFSITPDACVVSVYRGSILIAQGVGPRVFVPAAKTSVPWAGAYTAWFEQLAAIGSADVRALPPGVGHAAFTVPASGAFTLSVSLADSAKFKVPVRSDSNGNYLFFARPYGRSAGRFIVGQLATAGSSEREFVWRKTDASLAGTSTDTTLRSGFALTGKVSATRWIAPKVATTTPAITLTETLGLAPATGAFTISYEGGELEPSLASLPASLAVNAAGKGTLFPSTTPNPRKLAVAIAPKIGAFSGSFLLLDNRKVLFSGTVKPAAPETPGEASDIGRGYLVVPSLIKGGESTLGEIRLVAPALVPVP